LDAGGRGDRRRGVSPGCGWWSSRPLRVYSDLLVPSLVALWLAQLIVFAVYPRFAAGAASFLGT
jgi:hypothetical protein